MNCSTQSFFSHFLFKSVFFLFFILFFCVSPTFANEELTFPDWLKKHEVWDSYEKALQQEKKSPKNILGRAYSLLQQGKADEARQILRKYAPFKSKEAEAERLWLYGSTLRLQGEYPQAVETLSEALSFYSSKKQKELLLSQYALSILWEDVWRQWLWEALAAEKISSDQQNRLLRSARQALLAWPKNKFWKEANKLTEAKNLKKLHQSRLLPEKTKDRYAAAKALLFSAGGFQKQTQGELKQIVDKDLRHLWQALLNLLASNTLQPQSLSPLATDFFTAYSSDFANMKDNWNTNIADMQNWKEFHLKLKKMSAKKAISLLKKELGSALLSQDMRMILKSYLFTFQLMETDLENKKQYSRLKKNWKKLGNERLALPVRISAMLIFAQNEDFSDVPQLYPAFCVLAASTGYIPHSELQSSFWKKKTSYFDPLAHFQSLQSKFYKHNKKSPIQKEAALHLAYLFPTSKVAQKALFFLARQAQNEGKPILAWGYLQKINLSTLPKDMEIDYYLAQAGLEMQLGKEQESLKTYLDILQNNPTAIPPVKKLRLALLAQQQNEWEIADKLLRELWSQKEELSTELQAELLFWLGEGQQYLGQTEKALETYLRLGWKYPKENMWAVTALYRAGLMYEQLGRPEAAQKLYQTVVENSGRESQKEAAKQRIQAIKTKLKRGTQTLF